MAAPGNFSLLAAGPPTQRGGDGQDGETGRALLIVDRKRLGEVGEPLESSYSAASKSRIVDESSSEASDDDEIIHFRARIEQRDRDLDDTLTPKWYLVSDDSGWKHYWDAFIIVLAVYNGVFTPLEITFTYIK